MKTKSKYPHGTVKKIAQQLKLSVSTVGAVLNNDKGSRYRADILQATADYLNEVQTKEREARERLSVVISQAQPQA